MAGQNGLGRRPHGVMGQQVDEGVRQAVQLGKNIGYRNCPTGGCRKVRVFSERKGKMGRMGNLMKISVTHPQ